MSRLQSDLLCVEWDIKLYSLTQRRLMIWYKDDELQVNRKYYSSYV